MVPDPGARRPSRRQNVFLSSAPQASIVPAAVHGQRQRARHVPARPPQEHPARPSGAATTRSTESSVRVWMGRSWTRKRSAMPARRSSASRQVGDGLVRDVPLVMTSARAGEVREQDMVQGRVRASSRPAPAPRERPTSATSASGRRGHEHDRPGGRAHQRRLASEYDTPKPARAPFRRRETITANGLSSRCLRARRRCHRHLVGGDWEAKWKPPIPLTATIPSGHQYFLLRQRRRQDHRRLT